MKQKITLGRTKDNKKKILIIIIAIILIGTIAYNISNNIIVDKNKSINLVINNKNVTSNLKKRNNNRKRQHIYIKTRFRKLL